MVGCRLFVCWLMMGLFVFPDDGATLAAHPHDLTPVWSGTRITAWRFFDEDRPEFARPEWPASDRPLVDAAAFDGSAPEGVVWFRRDIELEGTLGNTQFLGLYLEEQATAYALYWDGSLVVENGRVAASLDEEKPANLLGLHPLSHAQSTPGRHVLAVRLSCHGLPDVYQIPEVELGTLNHFRGRQVDLYYVKLINLGMWFLVFALCLALFFGGRRPGAYLWFALFCLAVMGEVVASLWLTYFPHPVTYLPWKQRLYAWFPHFSALLLGLFFLANFKIPQPRRYMLAMVAVVLVCVIPALPISAFWYPLGLVVWQVWRGAPGAWPAAFGLGVVTLFFQSLGRIQSPVYSLTLVLFLVCMTLSMTLQIQARERLHRQSEMRSARLETQLLKKNIQPHFLMNTLLSIISWIEEQPSRAIAMVRALADEFRIIDRISGERLVPLAEELALCRAHLEIMGGRKDATYSLDVTCDGKPPMVPPLLLHTLMENALTHAFAPGESGGFALGIETQSGRCFLVLANGGSLLPGAGVTGVDEGVGMRYVRARLEESFPGEWVLDYGLEQGLWTVRVSFPVGPGG